MRSSEPASSWPTTTARRAAATSTLSAAPGRTGKRGLSRSKASSMNNTNDDDQRAEELASFARSTPFRDRIGIFNSHLKLGTTSRSCSGDVASSAQPRGHSVGGLK